MFALRKFRIWASGSSTLRCYAGRLLIKGPSSWDIWYYSYQSFTFNKACASLWKLQLTIILNLPIWKWSYEFQSDFEKYYWAVSKILKKKPIKFEDQLLFTFLEKKFIFGQVVKKNWTLELIFLGGETRIGGKKKLLIYVVYFFRVYGSCIPETCFKYDVRLEVTVS